MDIYSQNIRLDEAQIRMRNLQEINIQTHPSPSGSLATFQCDYFHPDFAIPRYTTAAQRFHEQYFETPVHYVTEAIYDPFYNGRTTDATFDGTNFSKVQQGMEKPRNRERTVQSFDLHFSDTQRDSWCTERLAYRERSLYGECTTSRSLYSEPYWSGMDYQDKDGHFKVGMSEGFGCQNMYEYSSDFLTAVGYSDNTFQNFLKEYPTFTLDPTARFHHPVESFYGQSFCNESDVENMKRVCGFKRKSDDGSHDYVGSQLQPSPERYGQYSSNEKDMDNWKMNSGFNRKYENFPGANFQEPSSLYYGQSVFDEKDVENMKRVCGFREKIDDNPSFQVQQTPTGHYGQSLFSEANEENAKQRCNSEREYGNSFPFQEHASMFYGQSIFDEKDVENMKKVCGFQEKLDNYPGAYFQQPTSRFHGKSFLDENDVENMKRVCGFKPNLGDYTGASFQPRANSGFHGQSLFNERDVENTERVRGFKRKLDDDLASPFQQHTPGFYKQLEFNNTEENKKRVCGYKRKLDDSTAKSPERDGNCSKNVRSNAGNGNSSNGIAEYTHTKNTSRYHYKKALAKRYTSYRNYKKEIAKRYTSEQQEQTKLKTTLVGAFYRK